MRKLLAVAVLTLAAFGLSSPAGAGGWAVVSLDPLASAPVPGRPFAVGFTIRQHGQTPVDDPAAAIVVYDASGARTPFPAHPAGATGHHVATVTLPAGGSYHWSVEHFLGTQDLGTVTAGPTNSAGGSGAERSPWSAPLLAIAAVLAGLGIVDLVRTRRPQPA
jgi:hypothetical protein